LQMLRAQMNPHFLFNALNTVLAAIGKSQDELKALVRALAEYLRYSLETRADGRVLVGQEFDAITSYLAVEKARFREKLEVECHIIPGARYLLVPGIIIQPLVENAIKHGRKTSPHPLRIRLSVSNLDSNGVQIEVSNTGKWVEPDPANTLGGVGLKNLKERLKLLYPDCHSFRITNENGWVTVQIQIPTTQ
jgi:two-component system, LytTR family, sensor kinase